MSMMTIQAAVRDMRMMATTPDACPMGDSEGMNTVGLEGCVSGQIKMKILTSFQRNKCIINMYLEGIDAFQKWAMEYISHVLWKRSVSASFDVTE